MTATPHGPWNDSSAFALNRGREIIAALREQGPEEALRLARHLVAEGGIPPGPRAAEQLLAAAAAIAHLDATAATDPARRGTPVGRHELAGICTEHELDQAMLTVVAAAQAARARHKHDPRHG